MSDTANPMSAMLDVLKEHGWTCEYPRTICTIHDSDRVPHRCVTVWGSLWGLTEYIWLSESGRVILAGKPHTCHLTDIDLSEFLRWLAMPEPVWNVATSAKKVLPGQRNLFEDNE